MYACQWINEKQTRSHSLCYILRFLQACKYALREASPLLGAEKINTMMQDHLIDAGNLHYPEFLADLVKIMVICLKFHLAICRLLIFLNRFMLSMKQSPFVYPNSFELSFCMLRDHIIQCIKQCVSLLLKEELGIHYQLQKHKLPPLLFIKYTAFCETCARLQNIILYESF